MAKERIGDVTGRPYPKSEVRAAVALAKRLKSCVAAAKELGIHPNTIRKWVRDAGVEVKNWRGKAAN